jgi:hypothetical protein
MIDLLNPTIKYAFSLPLGDELTSKALWQGADASIDPRDGKGYLFQMQAKATGPGDIEDINFHRYSLTEKNGLLTGATYVDTAIGKGFGHLQTLHTRISSAGNPYHWFGMEMYDKKNQATGTLLHRVMHKRGILQRSDAELIYTGSGSVAAISCPDWAIVLRRSGELYEWHREADLVKRTAADTGRPLPSNSIKVPAGNTTYQTAAASPFGGNFVRFNGATEDKSIITAFSAQWSAQLDVTAAAPAGLTVTSEEPEILFWYKDVLYFGKRYNSTARRVVAYFSIS